MAIVIPAPKANPRQKSIERSFERIGEAFQLRNRLDARSALQERELAHQTKLKKSTNQILRDQLDIQVQANASIAALRTIQGNLAQEKIKRMQDPRFQAMELAKLGQGLDTKARSKAGLQWKFVLDSIDPTNSAPVNDKLGERAEALRLYHIGAARTPAAADEMAKLTFNQPAQRRESQIEISKDIISRVQGKISAAKTVGVGVASSGERTARKEAKNLVLFRNITAPLAQGKPVIETEWQRLLQIDAEGKDPFDFEANTETAFFKFGTGDKMFKNLTANQQREYINSPEGKKQLLSFSKEEAMFLENLFPPVSGVPQTSPDGFNPFDIQNK